MGILITFGSLNISDINLGTNLNEVTDEKNHLDEFPIPSGHWYLNHTIEINGNSEWNTTAFTYDWCSGSGTWNDPYIIENVTINGKNTIDWGIYIQNSDVYFKINNCTVQNCTTGIRLGRTNNGTVSNNICKFNQFGIMGGECLNTTITGNFCYNNSIYGIYIGDFDNSTIRDNKCYNNNYENFYCSGSNEIEIINNTVVGNVYLDTEGNMELYDVNNSVISGNFIMNHRGWDGGGISLIFCHNNTLIANYIINNTVGIDIYYEGSTSNLIIGNIFSNNEVHKSELYHTNEAVGNLMDGYLDPTIISDDNGGDFSWTQFSSFAWAKGSGTFTDPYIIENIGIHGGNEYFKTTALTVENSTSYFIIRNCEFSHFYSGTDCAGIKLKNVENGKLINNKCWWINGDGIRLEFSKNNTITKNLVHDNRNGIYVVHDEFEQFNNNITKNTAEYNDNGFYITNVKTNSYLYPIRDNVIQYNDKYGMVFDNCMFMNISHNNVNANNDGIHLYRCVSTVITQNTINNNNGYGIILEEGSHNQINLNTLINNKECILEIDSTANNIGNNTCKNRIVIPGYNLFLIIFPITFTTMIIIILTKKRRIK